MIQILTKKCEQSFRANQCESTKNKKEQTRTKFSVNFWPEILEN